MLTPINLFGLGLVSQSMTQGFVLRKHAVEIKNNN